MMPLPQKLVSTLQEALAHHQAGRLAEADKLYRRVLVAAPNNFDAIHLSGLVAYQQGRHRDAVELLGRAFKLDPKSAPCAMRLGLAHVGVGDFAAGERHFRHALAREPSMAEAWCHLGMVLKLTGRLAEARTAYERALTLKPDYGEAHDRLGALVTDTEGFAAGVPHFRRAVELQPRHATGWANLGVALAQSAQQQEALTCFAKALELDPSNVLALNGRGFVRLETYAIAEAVADFDRVLTLRPDHHDARSARLLALHYLDSPSRSQMFAEHLAFGDAVERTMPAGRPTPRLPNSRDAHRRLRVAFLSPDLRAHAVAYFLEPLLGGLDRRSFDVLLYHDHPKVDAISARLRNHAALWRHFAGLPMDRVEAYIRSDAPDILIDLAGHTGFNRLPIYARRLAPVQLTYLGYPDTTGLRAMDYRFVDAVTDAEGEADPYHSEKLVRFAPTAWAFAPANDSPEPVPPPCAPGSPVTFGCFNNFSKVSETTVRGWARVLAVVPGSRLILKGHHLNEPGIVDRVRGHLAGLGVDEHRVELLGRTRGLAEHLGLYGRVDIALDTYPYHGTTTTCEALWMGVPVVSLAGDRHMARVGVSLLHAAGHPEWVAQDWDHYARIAAELAADRRRLALIRTTLRDDLQRGPLLDHAGQAARFGAALRACWEKWCAVPS